MGDIHQLHLLSVWQLKFLPSQLVARDYARNELVDPSKFHEPNKAMCPYGLELRKEKHILHVAFILQTGRTFLAAFNLFTTGNALFWF